MSSYEVSEEHPSDQCLYESNYKSSLKRHMEIHSKGLSFTKSKAVLGDGFFLLRDLVLRKNLSPRPNSSSNLNYLVLINK